MMCARRQPTALVCTILLHYCTILPSILFFFSHFLFLFFPFSSGDVGADAVGDFCSDTRATPKNFNCAEPLGADCNVLSPPISSPFLSSLSNPFSPLC